MPLSLIDWKSIHLTHSGECVQRWDWTDTQWCSLWRLQSLISMMALTTASQRTHLYTPYINLIFTRRPRRPRRPRIDPSWNQQSDIWYIEYASLIAAPVLQVASSGLHYLLLTGLRIRLEVASGGLLKIEIVTLKNLSSLTWEFGFSVFFKRGSFFLRPSLASACQVHKNILKHKQSLQRWPSRTLTQILLQAQPASQPLLLSLPYQSRITQILRKEELPVILFSPKLLQWRTLPLLLVRDSHSKIRLRAVVAIQGEEMITPSV